MSSPLPEPNQTARQSLAHLAAGELGSLASWRLRRQIARDPALAREWAEVQQLWGNLRSLQTLEPRPAWPAVSRRSAASDADRSVAGGRRLTGVPRLAAVGAAAVSAAGAIAFYQRPTYDDTPEYRAPAHHYSATTVDNRGRATLRGRVELYDNHARLVRVVSSEGDRYTPAVQNADTVAAMIDVDNHHFRAQGAGRYVLRGLDGTALGFAMVVPETGRERARWWRKRRQKMDFQLFGADTNANIGWGRARGSFGTKRGRVQWEFRGVALLEFNFVPSGTAQTVTRRGVALPHDHALRYELRQQLPPALFAAQVETSKYDGPELRLTANGKTLITRQYGRFELTLPDGTPATVDIRPHNVN